MNEGRQQEVSQEEQPKFEDWKKQFDWQSCDDTNFLVTRYGDDYFLTKIDTSRGLFNINRIALLMKDEQSDDYIIPGTQFKISATNMSQAFIEEIEGGNIILVDGQAIANKAELIYFLKEQDKGIPKQESISDYMRVNEQEVKNAISGDFVFLAKSTTSESVVPVKYTKKDKKFSKAKYLNLRLFSKSVNGNFPVIVEREPENKNVILYSGNKLDFDKKFLKNIYFDTRNPISQVQRQLQQKKNQPIIDIDFNKINQNRRVSQIPNIYIANNVQNNDVNTNTVNLKTRNKKTSKTLSSSERFEKLMKTNIQKRKVQKRSYQVAMLCADKEKNEEAENLMYMPGNKFNQYLRKYREERAMNMLLGKTSDKQKKTDVKISSSQPKHNTKQANKRYFLGLKGGK